jgi:hypothetical protein
MSYYEYVSLLQTKVKDDRSTFGRFNVFRIETSDNAPAPLFLYCVPHPPELRNGCSVTNEQASNYISILYYLFSTSKKCIAPYAMIMKAPENTARPITSVQKARLSKPNALRMEAPGTSISRPYL